MSWIKKLRDEMGDEVVLVRQKGHAHWGFIEGNVYKIIGNGIKGDLFRFKGPLLGDNAGEYEPCPSCNYAWEFEPAPTLSLENK